MTLSQLIDEASNLGMTIGLDAEVKIWFTGTEPVPPCSVHKPGGFAVGWDAENKRAIAEIRIKS